MRDVRQMAEDKMGDLKDMVVDNTQVTTPTPVVVV
jgi:hypothetical protein